MIKLCIWMNIPSHYQSALFRSLDAMEDVDLQVRYFHGVSTNRAAEGWNDEFECKPYEAILPGAEEPEILLDTVTDWQERTHVISSYFHTGLIDHFCKEGTRWCHWSEMPGVRLAELLGYRMAAFRLLNPPMLMLKRNEGLRIKRYALGAFGQGILARRSFQLMGVPLSQMADLYYAPEALPAAPACEQVVSFARGRKVFLSVGALCRRKGIDVLLDAFAQQPSSEWCLVVCGLDKANGQYHALARERGIEDRVLFLGAYPAARMAEVYRAADVFVLASRFDGWGAVLNEAASAGLPLIGTDLCGGSWHAIQHGQNGFRVKAGSVKALRTAMQTYIADPAICAQHGAASQKIYNDELTPLKNARRLVEGISEWSPQ